MTKRTCYKEEAKLLFTDFAKRHSFRIETIEDEEFFLSMRIPEQANLYHALFLGLQNLDEINIGYEKLWSYIFPFLTVKKEVAAVLDGIVNNTARLNIVKQGSRTVSRKLETKNENSWEIFYTEIVKFRIPFVPITNSYIYNTASGKEP